MITKTRAYIVLSIVGGVLLGLLLANEVSLSEITVPQINLFSAGLIGLISGFLLDNVHSEVQRYRRRVIESRDEKIRWYQDLAQYVDEINVSAQTGYTSLDVYEQHRREMVQSGTKQSITLEEVLDKDVVELLNLDLYDLISNTESGIESSGDIDPQTWFEAVDDTLSYIENEMNAHYLRLREHVASAPIDDLDDEVEDTLGKLIVECFGLSIHGNITEERYDRISRLSDKIVNYCDHEIENIEETGLL